MRAGGRREGRRRKEREGGRKAGRKKDTELPFLASLQAPYFSGCSGPASMED